MPWGMASPLNMGCRDNLPSRYFAPMKSETPVQRYRREAEECRLQAEKAMRTVDREAWLRLAADWTKLAEGAELK
jgi:hypothetical protein